MQLFLALTKTQLEGDLSHKTAGTSNGLPTTDGTSELTKVKGPQAKKTLENTYVQLNQSFDSTKKTPKCLTANRILFFNDGGGGTGKVYLLTKTLEVQSSQTKWLVFRMIHGSLGFPDSLLPMGKPCGRLGLTGFKSPPGQG